MEAADLSPAQHHSLMCTLADRRDWFGKRRDRMEAQGWRRDDPCYAAVIAARDAAHAAIRALHATRRDEPAPGAEKPAWLDRAPPAQER